MLWSDLAQLVVKRIRGSIKFKNRWQAETHTTNHAQSGSVCQQIWAGHLNERNMAKDAYYFPHDSNAKDDPKCIILIEELGLEGYGIFWVLIETLRDQPDYRASVRILPALARRYNTTLEKVKAVISRYDLFSMDGDEFFYSESLMDRMLVLEESRRKRQLAGRKGGNAKAMLKQSSGTALAVKESKGEKSKGEESTDGKRKRFMQPSIDDLILEMGDETEAHKFHDYYTSKGWMVGKSPMKDWRASVRNWMRNKKQNTSTPYLDSIDNKPF